VVIEEERPMKFVVLIQVDESEWRYVPIETPFDHSTPPRIFDTREEAEAEAAKWNTGKVMQYHG
jgi:hypothetical protein